MPRVRSAIPAGRGSAGPPRVLEFAVGQPPCLGGVLGRHRECERRTPAGCAGVQQMQRLVGTRRRLQLGPGGAEVTGSQREPSPDLPQHRPARRPGKIRGQRVVSASAATSASSGRSISASAPKHSAEGIANAIPYSAAISMTVRTSVSAPTSSPRRALTAACMQAAITSPTTEPGP